MDYSQPIKEVLVKFPKLFLNKEIDSSAIIIDKDGATGDFILSYDRNFFDVSNEEFKNFISQMEPFLISNKIDSVHNLRLPDNKPKIAIRVPDVGEQENKQFQTAFSEAVVEVLSLKVRNNEIRLSELKEEISGYLEPIQAQEVWREVGKRAVNTNTKINVF